MNPILDGILTLEGDYVNHPKDLGKVRTSS